jgi:hypothetical protein
MLDSVARRAARRRALLGVGSIIAIATPSIGAKALRDARLG